METAANQQGLCSARPGSDGGGRLMLRSGWHKLVRHFAAELAFILTYSAQTVLAIRFAVIFLAAFLPLRLAAFKSLGHYPQTPAALCPPYEISAG